jgi:hypothetical protein
VNANDKIKKIIGTEVHFCYPEFNKSFHPYTDSSVGGTSSCRIKSTSTIAFYSRKQNIAEKLFTRKSKSCYQLFKPAKKILLGYPILVFIDHNRENWKWISVKEGSHVSDNQ